METRAYLKGTRLSPQKAGLVADQIRGKKVDEAMDFLVFNKQKGAAVIKKLLESAIANAENNNCLLYTSPSPRDRQKSRMPSSA